MLRAFENVVLRKILEPKEEVTGGWITLNSEVHDLASHQILLG